MASSLPTLAEACVMLRVSRRTLTKWMKRLGIEPQRHPRDWRFYTLEDGQIETIRAARSEMPGQSIPVIPPYNSLDVRRRSPADSNRPIPTPQDAPLPPTPRPRQPQRRAIVGDSLPDGLVSITEVAETHGVFRYLSTFRRWRDMGKLEYDPGTYGGAHGQFAIVRPLTRKGLAEFFRLASPYKEWENCPDCPHAVDASPHG